MAEELTQEQQAVLKEFRQRLDAARKANDNLTMQREVKTSDAMLKQGVKTAMMNDHSDPNLFRGIPRHLLYRQQQPGVVEAGTLSEDGRNFVSGANTVIVSQRPGFDAGL